MYIGKTQQCHISRILEMRGMGISQHVGVSPPSQEDAASSPNFRICDTTRKMIVQTSTTSIMFILGISI